MLDTKNFADGPWKKSELITHEIGLDRIRGLYRIEGYSHKDFFNRLERDTKEKYQPHEIFGTWCSTSEFIDVPRDYAWNYLSNIYALEEWTYSIRQLRHIGNGIYKGQDLRAASTEIFIRSEINFEASTVDFMAAWDQKEELWMRSYLRLIDAKPSINRPGVIINRLSYKHPYFDTNYAHSPAWLKDAQMRKDRVWVGKEWPYMVTRHKIEAENLRFILEHRYHNKK